ESVLKLEEGNAWAKQFLPVTLRERANTFTILDRHAEAVADWDRIIALEGGSGSDKSRLDRAIALAHAGNHRRATAEAKELADKARDAGDTFYDTACVC